jgi:hypothetical protein
MHDLLHRVAIALLIFCGLLTTLSSVGFEATHPGAAGAVPVLLVRHWEFMMGLLGVGLLLSAAMPSLRLPAVGAAAASKAAFVVLALGSGIAGGAEVATVEFVSLALLLVAAAVFLREQRQEARWHGMLPSRRSV